MTIHEKLNQKIQEIQDICREGEYLFRGENLDYGEVSSNLYRQSCKGRGNGGDFFNSRVFAQERDTINKARNHVASGASDIEVLAQLQHHGGKTSLIDFTRNMFIALFFSCNESWGAGLESGRMIESSESGRIILFDTTGIPEPEDIEDNHDYAIYTSFSKNSRVVFQGSVFVRASKGYIEEGKYISIPIEKDIKSHMLNYLNKYHGINPDTVYNDLQGFIKNQQSLYAGEEYRNQVVQLFPEDPDAYYKLGNAKRKLGKLEEAVKNYDKTIELNPDTPEAYVNRGASKAELGKLKEAIEDFSKAIKLNPKLSEAYTNRGFAKFKLGKPEEAITDYDKAIELNPCSAEAYNNRGQAQIKLGKPEEAIADCDQAIKLNPRLAEPYLNRGFAKFKLGKPEEAITDCSKAIELNPMVAEAYNNRGIARGELGRLKEAIEDFNKAIELNPELSHAYFNRDKAKALLE